ncbi:MAG TPA: ELM1/GtrOC1 family putative glycosyltransferase, partial [Marinobacterium sp.]|nr:ELM1/GtrOC1 family putative glycosyltransferase [Marinobacterium sp.]
VFEALTAGCVVSLIGLESTLNSRTQRGMQMLLESGTVDYSTAFNSALKVSPLAEAERCAQVLLDRNFL